MKQLTGTPSAKGARLGWQLMALFLQCFPPDAMVEHFVERFLRAQTHDAHARALISLMYARVRTGPSETSSSHVTSSSDCVPQNAADCGTHAAAWMSSSTAFSFDARGGLLGRSSFFDDMEPLESC